MKYFYSFVAVAIVLTALSVWFVPGVDDYVEGQKRDRFIFPLEK
jgi:hypothetical protein